MAPSPKPPSEAELFAPIIWLANNEPAYPMLPHPFAFDGIDNDCDTFVDLEDPTEIDSEQDYRDIGEYSLLLIDAEAWRRKYEEWRPRDEELRRRDPESTEREPFPLLLTCERFRAYGYTKDGEKGPYFGPQARVLFVGEADRESVRSDGQGSRGWNDGRMATPSHWDDKIDPDTGLIQYWMYYPFDLGPNPHRHDGEHVSVFFERDRDDGTPVRVKGVLGAGHEDNSVNNALVAAPLGITPSTNLVLPRDLPWHMPILVELGKHASAPDVNCNGRFDLGADANVYSESVWGNRDLWAGSAGKTLKIGRFEPWFSFPRSREQRFLAHGWWEESRFAAYLRACSDLINAEELKSAQGDGPRGEGRSPDAEETSDTPLQTETGSKAGQSRIAARFNNLDTDRKKELAEEVARTYQLFRLRYLHELYEELRSDGCNKPVECARRLKTFFNEPSRKVAFWGDRAPDEIDVDPRAAERMRLWVVESDGAKHIERRDVWKHESFKHPNNDFRLWLFRRLGLGADLRVEGGNLLWGGLVRVADVLLKDSRVDLIVHWDRLDHGRPRRFRDAGFEYFSSRTRFVGSYFGFAYNRDFNTKVAGSAGLYFHLANFRSGRLKLPRDLSFSLYSGINGEVFRKQDKTAAEPGAPPTPTAGSATRAEALRFQVGFRAVWGFWGQKHPLAR